jgi:gliding motility associated protien GldN
MKKTGAILLIYFFSAVSLLNAQNNSDEKNYRHPIPLCYLREADIMWCRRVWRVIDLQEKINIPLGYPLHNESGELKSLMDVLYDAVIAGTLVAYDPVDDEFTRPMSIEEFIRHGGAGVDSVNIPVNPDNPEITIDTVIEKEFRFQHIVQYRIKEDVFFDKQRSVMETRIIGIAPLIHDLDDQGNIREGSKPIPVCWFYFPQARNELVNHLVFNRQNDGEQRTFDDIFIKRMFSSYIIKISNEFDRRIEDYSINPMDALHESERIKNEITALEHDMWEY